MIVEMTQLKTKLGSSVQFTAMFNIPEKTAGVRFHSVNLAHNYENPPDVIWRFSKRLNEMQ